MTSSTRADSNTLSMVSLVINLFKIYFFERG
jgi:hypothetical protein